MDALFNFQYEKGEPSQGEPQLSPRPSSEDVAEEVREALADEGSLPEEYVKAPSTLSPRPLFYVISEGEKRERQYLEAFAKEPFSRRVHLVFVSAEPTKGGLRPQHQYQKAEEAVQKGIISIGEAEDDIHELEVNDRIYLLADVDASEQQLRGYIKKAKGYQWIVSNPAFEIWLYYAYFDSPSEVQQKLHGCLPRKRSKMLKTLLGSLIPGGVKPKKDYLRIKTAISNASKNYKEDPEGFPELYSTQMFRFAQDLLDTAGDDEMLERVIEANSLKAKREQERYS